MAKESEVYAGWQPKEMNEYGEFPIYDYAHFRGEPDGPEEERAYIGRVGTFLDPRNDLIESAKNVKGRNGATLMHHVPMEFRGPYKLKEYPGLLGERRGPASYAMCTAVLQSNPENVRLGKAGRPCSGKAINRSGLCQPHGGALHPLDKRVVDWTAVPRYIRFLYGKLEASEMTEEEILHGGVRKPDGTWTEAKTVRRDVIEAQKHLLFKKSDELMQTSVLAVTKTFIEIANNPMYEPADRLRAAEFVYTRLRGKTPDRVVHSQDKPFEVILGAALTGGSRAASRAARGLVEQGEIVDAEVLEELEGYADDSTAEELVEEIDQEIDEEYSSGVDEDIPVKQEWNPVEKPTWIGPAGAPLSDPPQDPEIRQVYEEDRDVLLDEAEVKQANFRESAKQHKARLKAGYARRAQARKTGEPVDVGYEIHSQEVVFSSGATGNRITFSLPPDEGDLPGMP